MEEGELSDDDNFSCDTISSVGSVYFDDGSNNIYSNKSKSLDNSAVNTLQESTDARPTSPQTHRPLWISKTFNAAEGEITTESLDRANCANKGNKENFDTRHTYLTERLQPKESELKKNYSHSQHSRFLKRKHNKNENDLELTGIHEKKKRRKKRREKRSYDYKNHHKSSTAGDNQCTRKTDEKFRIKHGAKHKKNAGQKNLDDLLHRVISKSGPSQIKDISDPLISGCMESSLMKKLVGSGTLVVKSNSVSSDLKCEIGSTASISSPDMAMFDDLLVSSSDLESQGDVLVIKEPGMTDLEEHLTTNKNTQQQISQSLPVDSLTSVIVDSDDSDIEVIIPEKKVPMLVLLHSDGEEEEVQNSDGQNLIEKSPNLSMDVSNQISGDNNKVQIDVEENINTCNVEVNVCTENVGLGVTNYSSTLEEEEEDDDDILKLRMNALNSSKERSRLDINKILSETESVSQDNMTDKNLEKRTTYEDEDDLKLRAEALKSAFLRKHNERLKKGIQVKKVKMRKSKDKEQHSSGSSVYSPSNITSPLSPTSSYELSLQGEEDMVICESDIEDEIIDVPKIYENKWKEADLTIYPVVTNSWINGNTAVSANEFYPSTQEYFTLSKHTLEYSQPLPPGVEPIASSNLSVDPFCSTQFISKHLTAPPLLSLGPPPPPPPLSQQSLLVNDSVVNKNQNVTEFVQSGNEFSVHHKVHAFDQNNTYSQSESTFTQSDSSFYVTDFSPSVKCSNISEPTENNCLRTCLNPQGKLIENLPAMVSDRINLTNQTYSVDTNNDVCQPLSTLREKIEIIGANSTKGSRQNVKSRPNLLQVPINKNIVSVEKQCEPLKKNNIQVLNNQEKFVIKNDTVLNTTRLKKVNSSNEQLGKKITGRARKRLQKKDAKYGNCSQILENTFENIDKQICKDPSAKNICINITNNDSREIITDAESNKNNTYLQDCEINKLTCDNFNIHCSPVIKKSNSDSTCVIGSSVQDETNFTKEGEDKTEPEVGSTEKSPSQIHISKSVQKHSDNEQILNFVSNENSPTTENTEESDIDFSEMIVIDEIGMSPENHSKNVSEEISECQNDDDDDDDLEALRAKVLTSIPTKVIDCPKMPNKPKDNLKNVNNKLVRENCTSNKTLPYNKHNNKSDHFPLNRTELGEKSRYRLSRVINSEPVRSVVKGKSLKIVLPSDVPNISKPNIVSMPEVSPPQVPRLVINVGQDSDTDEDLHNESDEWSRRVMIRNLENKHFGEEETNNLDVEKSVEMFLSNVRRQHESTLQNDKFVHFDESIDTNKNQLSKHCNEPIKEHVIATEFNVTGVFPLTKTPIKRISTSDETPVRLLPLSKQEEYKKLKQELENMEKQRKQIHKSTGLVTSKLKPSSSPLRYTLLNETHKKANETQFKQNQLGERILPLQRTNTPLVETNVNSKQNVSSAEASVELGSGAINVRLKDTLKRPEIQRVEAAEQKAVGDLEKAEKELLSERYSVIDELTEMNNLLGDFERAQEKLHNNQSEVIKLRKELLAAELKLENQKHVVSTIQKDFFATHTKMISGTLSCKQWEKTCSKLGLQINGTRYEVPNGGKNLLVKKLQQVAERSKELKIKERSSAQRSFLNSKSSNLSSENQGISEFKSGNCTRSESQEASEPSSQQTSEEVETCKVSDSHKGSKSEDFESVRSSITNPSEKSDNLILTRNVSKEVLDVSDVNNASSFNNNTVVGISDRTKTNLPQQFTAFREVAIKDNCAVAVPTSKCENSISSYESPLSTFGKAREGRYNIAGNPQAILCPYDLMGKCLDDSCQYMHHTKSS